MDDQYKSMIEELKVTIEKGIRVGIEVGTRQAFDNVKLYLQQEKKNRMDKRLRNIELLLNKYKELTVHCQESIYSLKDSKNAIDILYELEDIDNDNMYVEAIKKSKDRTAIIMCHVKVMLDAYRYILDRTGQEEEIRKYRIIKAMYLDEYSISWTERIEETAGILGTSPRQVYRYMKKAKEELSVTMFGVDALNRA